MPFPFARPESAPPAPALPVAAPPRRVVVLGIGNLLLGDDGVGVHAAAALRDFHDLPPGVEVVDGGTAGMELLDVIGEADLVLVLDAVKAGREPGTLVCLQGSEVPAFFRSKLSPHQVSLCDVLASLEFIGRAPRELLLVGVEPASLELGLELTAAVAARVPDLVAHAVQALADRAVVLRPRDARFV